MPSAGNAGYGFGMAVSGESLRLGHIGRTEGLEFDTMPRGTVSEVKAVREVKPGIVAVLIAQPLSNWRNIPFDTQTFRGSWNLYKGIMEIVDVRRGVLLGRASFAGYPRAILSDDRLAVYRELEDGRPIIEIYQFSLPRR